MIDGSRVRAHRHASNACLVILGSNISALDGGNSGDDVIDAPTPDHLRGDSEPLTVGVVGARAQTGRRRTCAPHDSSENRDRFGR